MTKILFASFFILLISCTSKKSNTDVAQNVVIKNKKETALNVEKTSIEKTPLPVAIEGEYYTEDCNIRLTIYQSKGLYYYNYKSDERNVKGEAIITQDEDTVYIALSGMEFAEDYFDLIQEANDLEKQKKYEALQKKGKRRTVSCTYSSKGLYMQNYGNLMDPYTQLYDCDKKYIHFKKQSLKEKKQAVLTKFMAKQFADYSLFDWVEGDINNDDIPDFIVVLQAKKPNEDDFFVRKIVLVETLAFPQLKIAAVNDNLVACSDCGGGGVGDPYRGIVIKNNYFSVEELYGACCKDRLITTFKYAPKKHNWVLHKEGKISSCCNKLDADGGIFSTTTIKTKKDFGTILFKDY